MVNSGEFHYDLPESAIAKHPLAVRRHARLLVRDTKGGLTHSTFEALPDWLDGVDGLWANDTKVLHARLLATKPTGGQLEVFLLAPAGLLHEEALAATAPVRWQAMIRNVKRWSQGVASVEGRACTLTIEHAGQGRTGFTRSAFLGFPTARGRLAKSSRIWVGPHCHPTCDGRTP